MKAQQRQREENTQHILFPALISSVTAAKGREVEKKIWGVEHESIIWCKKEEGASPTLRLESAGSFTPRLQKK